MDMPPKYTWVPILGGILSDPAGSYPDLFGKISFFVRFPYAAPNIVSFLFLLAAAVAVWLGLECMRFRVVRDWVVMVGWPFLLVFPVRPVHRPPR